MKKDPVFEVDRLISAANAEVRRIDSDMLKMKERRTAIEEKKWELEELRESVALAIEAATAGETTKIGSTEGESAGPKDNAQNMSGPSHE